MPVRVRKVKKQQQKKACLSHYLSCHLSLSFPYYLSVMPDVIVKKLLRWKMNENIELEILAAMNHEKF